MAKKREIAPKSKRGGRRAGAGRKPTAVKKLREEAIAECDQLIIAKLDKIIANLMKLADQGDREACKYLLDRVMGRPKQSVEASGPDGQPIPIRLEQAIERAYGEAEAKDPA